MEPTLQQIRVGSGRPGAGCATSAARTNAVADSSGGSVPVCADTRMGVSPWRLARLSTARVF